MNSISNEWICATFSPKGAELKSLEVEGTEYLWTGDEKIWNRSAPILFPVVGKPFGNELLISGKSYTMPQHGFARDREFELIEQTEDAMLFRLVSDAGTLPSYPYHFDLRLGYRLMGKTLECSYEVKHTGSGDMYFSIGAHPGFRLPTGRLSDYTLVFEHPEEAERYLLHDGLLSGQTEPVLRHSTELGLDPSLFAKDALVFKQLRSKKITLMSRQSSYAVDLAWDDFPYLGIWCKSGCEAFICMEPWCGIAGSAGGQVPVERKEGMNCLGPGETFRRTYSMTFYND
jgi:galactose mutarotase-like enzyme